MSNEEMEAKKEMEEANGEGKHDDWCEKGRCYLPNKSGVLALIRCRWVEVNLATLTCPG